MRKIISRPSGTRRRVYRVIAATVLAGLLFIAWSVIRDAKRMAWADYTASSVGNLAMFIETYRDDHGRYPSSLEELQQEQDSEGKILISKLLTSRIVGATNHYEYRPSSDGFVIIAAKPGGLLYPAEKMEKQYKANEPHERQ